MEFFISVLLLVLTLTLTLYFLFSRNTNKTKMNLPPGPKPFPIIGNIPQLGKNPHQSLANLAEIHGPIMTLKLGQITTIVVSSPDLAKEILKTHDQFLSNRVVPHVVEVHDHQKYNMAFLPVSPRWRELRKTCNNHLFNNKTLDAGQTLRREKLLELLSDIHQSSLIREAVDIGRATFKTAINFLSNTMYSMDLVDSADSIGDFKELVRNIMQVSGEPNFADFFPALKIVDPQGINGRNYIYNGKILQIFRLLIDERLKSREVEGFDEKSDMLNTLLNIAQAGNDHEMMDKTQIQHLSLTLFVAGTETITSTLEWAVAELLKNEKAMLKAKQELEQVIGKGKPVEESDIARLPYLQAVIKETLRLHPPVPFLIPRKASANVEVYGYTIPKDAHILVNVWAIGRSSSIWENVTSFSPERFLKSDIDVKGHHYELIPFGAGRRICPGLPLAMRMLYLMLGSLINCFNWKLEDGAKIDNINMEEKFGMTLARAQPMRVIPEKISN